MENRKKAVELIHRQLKNESASQDNKSCHHYGLVELRELMDFIYGGEPSCPEETMAGRRE